VIFRELGCDEFDRIPPEAIGGVRLRPSHRVAAALEGEDIVGVWVVGLALHAEPIWIREDHRKSPTIVRRLWDNVKAIVRDMGCPGVVGIIPDSVPADKRIAEWLGAEPIPGAIYLWLDKEAKEK
jgi:hypothetical protein